MLPCRLGGKIQPPLTTPVPDIAWRAGIDLNPLDVTDDADAAWLRALVWADHRSRARLLDNALLAAASGPAVPIHAGDAAERLPALLEQAPAETAVCVFHTAFLAHLAQPDRDRFERLIVTLSASRTIYWVQAEPAPTRVSRVSG